MKNPVVVTSVSKDIIPMISVNERPPRAQEPHSQMNDVVCNETETSDEVYESVDDWNDANEDPVTIGGRIEHLNNENRSQVYYALLKN